MRLVPIAAASCYAGHDGRPKIESHLTGDLVVSENLQTDPLIDGPRKARNAKRGVLISGGIVLFAVPISIIFIDRPVAFAMAQMSDEVRLFFYGLGALGEGFWPLVVAGVLFVVYRWGIKNPAAAIKCLYVASVLASNAILVNLLKVVFGRPRPRLLLSEGIYEFGFFELSADWRSFPSGHAVTAFGLAVALSIIFPRFRAVFWSLAVAAGSARVAVNSHFVSDVIAGAYLASVVAVVLAKSFERAGCPLRNR